MLEFTLGIIFGFVAGCSLKDFILSKSNDCKKFQMPKNPLKLDKEDLKQDRDTQAQNDTYNNSLTSVQYNLFLINMTLSYRA